jgi:hypothetical protein
MRAVIIPFKDAHLYFGTIEKALGFFSARCNGSGSPSKRETLAG